MGSRRVGAIVKVPNKWWVALLPILVIAVVVISQRSHDGPESALIEEPVRSPEQIALVRFWEVYRAAMSARRAGQWAEATDLFEQALAIRSDHEDSHYYMGNALFELGEYQRALDHWEALLAVNPMAARAHVQLGTLRTCSGVGEFFDLSTARIHMRKAYELNLEETGAIMRLGEIEFALGNLDEAESLLEATRNTNPRAASAHYLCAYLEWTHGDEVAARASLELAFNALEVKRATAEPVLEGDIRKGDSEKYVNETMLSRRLFAPLLAAMIERASADPAVEASHLKAYIDGLSRPE